MKELFSRSFAGITTWITGIVSWVLSSFIPSCCWPQACQQSLVHQRWTFHKLPLFCGPRAAAAGVLTCSGEGQLYPRSWVEFLSQRVPLQVFENGGPLPVQERRKWLSHYAWGPGGSNRGAAGSMQGEWMSPFIHRKVKAVLEHHFIVPGLSISHINPWAF